MGRMIEKIIKDRGLEYAGWSEAITETDPALAKECVCIDFTTPAAFRANYKFLAENFGAVVIGTTGWADIKDEVIAYFEKCGTPIQKGDQFCMSCGTKVESQNILCYNTKWQKIEKRKDVPKYILF